MLIKLGNTITYTYCELLHISEECNFYNDNLLIIWQWNDPFLIVMSVWWVSRVRNLLLTWIFYCHANICSLMNTQMRVHTTDHVNDDITCEWLSQIHSNKRSTVHFLIEPNCCYKDNFKLIDNHCLIFIRTIRMDISWWFPIVIRK
jgi:hypothetical protein